MTNLLLLFLVACSDFGLTPVKDDPAAFDTASADTAPTDTAQTDAPDTAASDTAELGSPAGCGTFSFTWTAPTVGVVELEGEFTQPDGAVVLAWSDLASASGNTASAALEVCPPLVFRGQGLVRTDDGGVGTWSCMRQSDEDVFAVVGTVEMSFDGTPLTTEITPAPTSDGCELTAAL